ncbi:MAG TPA: SEC-C metal-binding domain-containing protein [Thiobacillus sp.]|nr:SEC-C metal-binding domain-containing protein [Thiobacillus sp.]
MNDIPVFDPDTLSHAPVGDLLNLLIEHEDRVPHALFDACVARGEDMVAALADFYARLGADDERDVWWMGLHALFLLGAIPGEAAGRLLIDALRRAGREDDLLLDWVAGDTAWLFANKPSAVIDQARELMQDRNASWFVRCEAVDPVVAAGLAAGPAELDAALDWLADLVTDTSDDPDFRLLAASNLLDFPRQRHRALLDAMAVEQEAGPSFNVVFGSDDVAHSFADATDAPGWVRRGEPWTFYDEAEILARQERWREENARAASVVDQHDDLFDFPEPYVREQPKPGRNDPCPCGSGMKYKKCCLPADEAREALARQLH